MLDFIVSQSASFTFFTVPFSKSNRISPHSPSLSPDTGRQRRPFFVLFSALGLLQRHGMDIPAFQQLQAQFVKCSPVESLRTTGGCTLEIHSQVLKGGLCGQGADAPAGHADGVPFLQIPLLFVGKLLKRRRDRLCLYSVPEDFGVVPAIVARPDAAPLVA